jgi:CRISPR system Cascade subunit CasE
MELTRIQLNLGDPNARRDLADPYQMHSTLVRAFVQASDEPALPFLWRLDEPRQGEPPVLLVQSMAQANWSVLDKEVPSWALRRETRQWDPDRVLRHGQRVVFRIRCNPTVTRHGKRLGLWRELEQREWFERQAITSGLTDLELSVVTSQRVVGRRRKGGGADVVVCAAMFEGHARIDDVATLTAAIARGIGHAKMMGLGLLSIALAG